MAAEQTIAIIDDLLHGHGDVIYKEAELIGLDLALACALVEQESNGLNIFGCDHGSKSPEEPPYCRVKVTAERVGLLLQHIEENGFSASNGVGIVQLTWPPLIWDAQDLGGAHRPRFQCRVGFQELRNLIERYGTRTGLGIYNGGPSSPNYDYAWSVLEKRNAWRRLLK